MCGKGEGPIHCRCWQLVISHTSAFHPYAELTTAHVEKEESTWATLEPCPRALPWKHLVSYKCWFRSKVVLCPEPDPSGEGCLTDSLDFIDVHWFLCRIFQLPITLQKMIVTQKSLPTSVRCHSTFWCVNWLSVHNYAYSKANKTWGISWMSPDSLLSGEAWAQSRD